VRLAAGRPSQFVGTGRGFSSNFSIRRWFAARGRRTSSTRASRRPRLGRKEGAHADARSSSFDFNQMRLHNQIFMLLMFMLLI